MLSLRLPRLLSSHQVPKAFQEDGIISGYRCPKSSAFDCILSLFHLTNETLNIWTHFLPACYFMRRLLGFSQSLDFLGEAYTWPLLAYLFTCCLYLLASSLAHTFSTMSVRSLHVCFFFDYAALSLYSLGSGIAYAAYIFPEQWVHGTLHAYFVPTAVMNTLLCTSLACYSRFTELDQPHFSKLLRILAFFCPYLFDNIPLFYRVGDGITNICSRYTHIAVFVILAFCTAEQTVDTLAERNFANTSIASRSSNGGTLMRHTAEWIYQEMSMVLTPLPSPKNNHSTCDKTCT
uniref:Membrane progestin receptor delta isoform 2 n=1 Tax=Petromyzon marinus TaxID=7757 RepID=A0A1I9VZE7_PETMA|nr:membrane progestin receptor gamma-B-like isoform X2 [Petromyzon marinus]APA19927.1 membrane progestin receptor delta isoform 2 [Petromyzon marinus]APA19928.1 membrane progestin receptor delta isoform 3 [Petromyzon marinus]APA19929.1 membrane progestin receptor delta isoform 4 [Petromyzon marinus]